MTDGVDIDLYADVDHEFAQEDSNYNGMDLYDDMLQPSRTSISRQTSSNGLKGSSRSAGLQYNYQGKKVSIYVGNLTWWTTDKDLQKAIAAVGVTDVLEIKFYENRANGQSKGFALVHLLSESSSRMVMEKLPHKDLHGQSPVVTPCNRQSLNQFEQQSKAQSGGSAPPPKPPSPAPPAPVSSAPQFSKPPPTFSATSTHVAASVATAHASILSQPLPRGPPPPFPTLGTIVRIPPPIGIPPPRAGIAVPPPGVPPHGLPPPRTLVPPPGIPPPSVLRSGPPPRLPPNLSLQPPPRIVIPPPTSLATASARLPPPIGIPPPSVLPQLAAVAVSVPTNVSGPPPPLPVPAPMEAVRQETYQLDGRSQSPSLTEPEIEEIMVRNRAVSSSAISRAVADASSGEYGSAIETLVTAISLIKQSKVARDERAKVLIGSLQDCLHGIEEKSFGSGGSGRKRDRSRDREERPRHRESKSRRRDRDRDRSRSRDRYDDREYRDRSRDRDSGGSYSRHSDRDRHRR